MPRPARSCGRSIRRPGKGAEDNIGFKHRGVAVWRDGGELRIFLNTDSRLFSLDAKTGKPVADLRTAGAWRA